MKPEYYVQLAHRVYPEHVDFKNTGIMAELEADKETFLYEWVLYIIQEEDPWMGKALTQEETLKYEARMSNTGRFVDLFALLRISRDQIHNIEKFGKAYWS